jgi:plastocyanin
VLLVAAVAAVATACGGGSSAKTPAAANPGPAQHPTKLVGDVGHNDAFEITLKDQSGAAINNLAAGTYTLTVDDESTIHDFHLTGPGVDETTAVGSTGTKTFTVTFKPGTYSFVCDPHAGSMHGQFTVS